MPIILHVGTHKTGTTAIQQFATLQRHALRQRGLWYPLYRDIDWASGANAHHALSHALAEDDDSALAKARRFVEFVKSHRRAGETVLLSAEPIYRHVYPVDATDYWGARAAYMQRLRDLLGVDDVQVLMVVRRQDRFAKSLYQERVLSSHDKRSFPDFLAGEEAPFQYQRQLDVFEPLFGPATVLVYEDLCRDGLIDSFFAHLRVQTADLAQPAGVNESLSVPLVEFKRMMNSTALDPVTLKLLSRTLRQKHFSAWRERKLEWVPSDQMLAFARRYDEDNVSLAQRYFPHRKLPLFPGFEAYAVDQVFGGLTATDVAEMTAALTLALELDQRARAETHLPARFAKRLKTLLTK